MVLQHLTEIETGIHRLRMPLPFELNHVNVWLLSGANGAHSIIDTGFNYQDTVALWDKTLADKTIDKILVTHFHPDHFGLAGYICGKTGITPVMTRQEHETVIALMDEAALAAAYAPYYTAAGIAGDLYDSLMDKRLAYKKIISVPPDTVDYVRDGDTVTLGDRPWRVITGAGHTPEHICLYDDAARIFIAGDIVLPRITPNISFFPGCNDPLGEYLAALEKIRGIVADDVAVLPSHGEPFRGLHGRIDEIAAHHEKRLSGIRDICADTPLTAYDIMAQLFSHRTLGIHDLFFALGETLAHLVYDVKRGFVTREPRDGVDYYRSTTNPS